MGEGGPTKDTNDGDLLSINEEADGTSFDELFHRWFEQTWNVAKSITRDNKSATEATSAAFLQAVEATKQHDEDAFGPYILRTSRQEALKLSDDNVDAVQDSGDIEGTWHKSDVAFPTLNGSTSPLVGFTDPRSQQEIVWAVASVLGNARSSLADLNIRYGLTARELAVELGVKPDDAYGELSRLKSDLERVVVSFFLWKTGRSECSDLARLLKDHKNFDEAASTVITDHLKDCPICRKHHKKLGTGEPLYSSVPFFVVPLSQKARAISDLASEGTLIDLEGSASSQVKNEKTETFAAIDTELETPTKKDLTSDSPKESTEPGSKKAKSKKPDPKKAKSKKLDSKKANEASSVSNNKSSSLPSKPPPSATSNGKPPVINLVDHAAKTAALDPDDVEAAKNVTITANTKLSTTSSSSRSMSTLDAASRTAALDPSDVEVAKNVSIKSNAKASATPSVELSSTNNDSLSDALADRFPVSKKPSQITERFEAVSAPESSFAQDAPVRYSRRAPRAPAPEPARRAPSSKVLILAAISATLLIALALVMLRDDDPSGVSATGDVTILAPTTTLAPATTRRQVAPVTTDESVKPSPTRATRRPTTTAAPTTIAPTTTLPPTTTIPPTTLPQMVAVPNVIGLSSQAASAQLTAAGFKVRVRQVPTQNPAFAGLVRASNPAPGALAKADATVTIQVLTLQ